MKKAFLFSFLFSLALSLHSHARWDLNDVTYLMPLPQNHHEDFLLRLESAGRGGNILHPQFLSQIPLLTLPLRAEEAVSSLRVVAVRIDPCFPLPSPQSCQRQVRLVWQPLELDRKNQIRTADAALHSFYRLSDEDFLALIRDIALWKKRHPSNTRGTALQIHPVWARQGTRSPALLEFQSLLQKHIGMRNFFRMTAMFLRGAGNMWAFASYELQNGRLAAQPIARLADKKAQTFVNLSVPSDHFSGGGVSPVPTGADVLDPLLKQSDMGMGPTEETIRSSFQALYKIENPRFYNPENMDCVSCHIAQPLKHAFMNKYPNLKLQDLWRSSQYQNNQYNLANLSPQLHDTQIIRGLGYFGSDIAISQRVIHESAEVANWLNRNLK